MGKIFAIGDIHGCADKLQDLLNILDIDADNDILLFIGDYVDRGPNTKAVVDTVLSLRQQFGNVICLMGNHEQLFLGYCESGEEAETFLYNGGRDTIASYGLPASPEAIRNGMPEAHNRFFSTLLPYYETDRYIFVHAGLRPHVPLGEQDLFDLLWIRNEFIFSAYDFGKIVVFGHTPFVRPLIEDNKIGIDTGAVYGGKLTCVELPEILFHQV